MKWIWLLIVIWTVIISTVTAQLPANSHNRQSTYRNHRKYTHAPPPSPASSLLSAAPALPQKQWQQQQPTRTPYHGPRAASVLRYQQQHQKHRQSAAPLAHALLAASPMPVALVEIDTLKCPLGCVCQYARFMDLPISRWINYMQMRQPLEEQPTNPLPHRRAGRAKRAVRAAYGAQPMHYNEVTYEEQLEQQAEVETDEDEEQGAEENVTDELPDIEDMLPADSDEESFSSNPYIKQATCILQADADAAALIDSLPHDLQALILLYTGIAHNKTVNSSIFKKLNQLNTLEVRGPQDRTLQLIIDEPLSFLQHANFESITLMGSDSLSRPKGTAHPSDSYDYKPKSEFLGSYEYDGAEGGANGAAFVGPDGIKLDFKKLDELDEPEILPYDIYLQKVKEARMPSFYGWEHLEVLRIHACELNELYWEMFDGLGGLQHLSLERNDIEVLPPFALYGALHIKTLSLAHNRIQDLHYRALAGLLDLKWLDLSDNRLNKLSELSFPPFPKLRRVDFRQNPIKYIFPATFWVMNATREMHFDSREMALELWANQPFISLIQLRELYMGNVSIGNLEHNVFRGLIALEKLTLKGSVRAIEFDAFAGLTSLQELDLSNCHIQHLSMDAFMGCKMLTSLNLSHNNISYIPPGLFDDQHALQEIYLQHNQLRVLPYTFFLQPQLHVARLSDNPWHCSCDMDNWLPKVTNQERGARVERCIRDFHTGRKLGCRLTDSFKFDHRLAPRCANYNGRSVYYVMRKQLQCGPGRLVRSKQQESSQAQIQNRQKVSLEPRKSQQQPQSAERTTWQMRREQKQQRNKAQQNRLEYVLHQQRRISNERTKSQRHQVQRQRQVERLQPQQWLQRSKPAHGIENDSVDEFGNENEDISNDIF